MSKSIITIEGDIDGAWGAYVRRMSKYLDRGGGSDQEKALAMLPDIAKPDASANEVILVLISHSSIDVPLALALIHLLRSGLGLVASQIRCSSVDGYRLPAGVNTDAQLRKEIKSVKVLIGLLTPNSLSSTYVLLELGARWGDESFMIPLLAGIQPEQMRGPHSVLNALSCASEQQLIQLVDDIGRELNMKPQSVASYLNEVRAVKTASEKVAEAEGKKHTVSGEAEKLNQQRAEIATLKVQIAALKRKPYAEALERTATELLSRLSADGKRLLRHLLQNEPLDVSNRFITDISVDDQTKQLGIAMNAGLVRHNDVRAGAGNLLRTDGQAPRPVEQLWAAPKRSPESDELDVLVTLIEAYENKHYPNRPSV